MRFLLLQAALALFSFTLMAQQPSAKLSAQSFATEVTLKVGYHYALYLPEDYAKNPAKKWPLIIFLHGSGERGDDLVKLNKHGPPKLVAGGQSFPVIIVAPQCPSGKSWDAYAVKALVDEAKKNQRVDNDRVYLTGISMGGFGTWDTLCMYPDVFAAAVPICGGAGINVVRFDALKEKPIWIFHGAKDSSVPVSFSETAYARLQKGGATKVKLTIYPDAPHDCWTETFENAELWKWLFEQKLSH